MQWRIFFGCFGFPVFQRQNFFWKFSHFLKTETFVKIFQNCFAKELTKNAIKNNRSKLSFAKKIQKLRYYRKSQNKYIIFCFNKSYKSFEINLFIYSYNLIWAWLSMTSGVKTSEFFLKKQSQNLLNLKVFKVWCSIEIKWKQCHVDLCTHPDPILNIQYIQIHLVCWIVIDKNKTL